MSYYSRSMRTAPRGHTHSAAQIATPKPLAQQGHRVIMVLLATGVEYVVVVDGITEDEIAAFVDGLEAAKDPIRVINS